MFTALWVLVTVLGLTLGHAPATKRVRR